MLDGRRRSREQIMGKALITARRRFTKHAMIRPVAGANSDPFRDNPGA